MHPYRIDFSLWLPLEETVTHQDSKVTKLMLGTSPKSVMLEDEEYHMLGKHNSAFEGCSIHHCEWSRGQATNTECLQLAQAHSAQFCTFGATLSNSLEGL